MLVMKIVAMLLSALFLMGISCGEGAYPEPEDVTRFIEFRYQPNDTVSVGDTLRIQCVIEDSLDTTIEFRWVFMGKETITRNDYLEIITDSLEPGQLYTGKVSIKNNPTSLKNTIIEYFKFYVESNE